MLTLLALDLDGTLLDHRQRISPENLAALQSIYARQGSVVLCSARPISAMQAVLRGTALEPLIRYFIGFNGAWIYDAHQQQDIHFHPLSSGDIQHIDQLLTLADYPHHFFTRERILTTADPADPYTHYEAEIFAIPLQQIAATTLATRDDIVKISLVGSDEYIAQIAEPVEEKIAGHYSASRTGDNYYEIMQRGWDKGRALQLLSQHLNIAREHIIAIGDRENDISMLQFAAIGVAMDNANDAVKRQADFITLHHDNSGVAYAINRLWE